MSFFLAIRVKLGLITLEEVPEKYRDSVSEMLARFNANNK